MYSKEMLKNSTLTQLRDIAEKLKLDGYQRLKKNISLKKLLSL